mmetsp:Transcript_38584/g.59551  ORF Transcript_38584/g.59551 Transcript_38584/m.59551 type:complete len:136 (+) Transcript_38584:733-1140(+)
MMHLLYRYAPLCPLVEPFCNYESTPDNPRLRSCGQLFSCCPQICKGHSQNKTTETSTEKRSPQAHNGDSQKTDGLSSEVISPGTIAILFASSCRRSGPTVATVSSEATLFPAIRHRKACAGCRCCWDASCPFSPL